MAGKFRDDDDDDVLKPTEPQVNSLDPEERKAARALRIKRRQDALKKAELPPEEAILVEDATLTEKATAEAAEYLQRCGLEGAAKVTNVKVTTDEREVHRRNVCAAASLATQEKIEAEAAETQLQYEAIARNWEAMLKIKDPLDIDAAMIDQKHKCDELLALKDGLINKLKGDLKRMDEEYYEDLNKQDSDIKELSERIEKQITIMQRAYEKQLNLIETAMNIERESMVSHNNKRWDALYKQRDKEELQHIDYKFAQLEEHKEEIEKIMWDHHEKYRTAKVELETLIQELQKELEKLKATCLINTEKIGYNYQVLKKREEENVFVRSQQKRKLNKMTDMANGLRNKIRKAATDGADEEKRADAEIKKLMQLMEDLERKSRHFADVNNYKFIQVWRMAASRCLALCHELRSAEIAMHAHVLAEPPPAPPPPPPRSPFTKDDAEQEQIQGVTSTALSKKDFSHSKDKLVRHILQLVADNTGFLVEDRLLTLIAKYPLTSRNLCTLDAIFMALEISAEQDVELLCDTFVNYAFCPICVGMEDGATSDYVDPSGSQPEQARGRGVLKNVVRYTCGLWLNLLGSITPSPSAQAEIPPPSSVRARASIARSMSTSTSRSVHVGFRGHELSPDDQMLITEADEIMTRVGDPQAPQAMTGAASDAGGTAAARRGGPRGVTVTSQLDMAEIAPADPYRCSEGHYLEIEPMQVLTALGDFISKFVPPEKKKLNDLLDSLKPPSFETQSRKMTEQEIEQYWALWKISFPPEKDRFWDGILKGLTNYLEVLKDRDRLHEEVVLLRRRNAALRRVVRGSLPSDLPPIQPPQYTGPYPDAFTATVEDMTKPRLPKI